MEVKENKTERKPKIIRRNDKKKRNIWGKKQEKRQKARRKDKKAKEVKK